jgi:hypothetical protein
VSHLRMGSTIMLNTVGAEGAGGYGIEAWSFREPPQALQQQKRMIRQRIVPPIMALGEVKIQWLRMLSCASAWASFIIAFSSWIRTSASNLPAILVLSRLIAEMTTSLSGCWKRCGKVQVQLSHLSRILTYLLSSAVMMWSMVLM